MSDDNTAIAMLTYDYDLKKYVSKIWCFIPADRLEDKKRIEKVPYDVFAKQGICILCNDKDEGMNKLISYEMVEDFILSLPQKYGVTIKNITYDRYNAIRSMQRLESEGYDTIQQNQFGSYLHGGTKKLKEVVLNQEFLYETNRLFEMNMINAKVEYDNDLKMKVNKRKSRLTGKIDMVDALINCFCTAETEELEGYSIYEERGFLIL